MIQVGFEINFTNVHWPIYAGGRRAFQTPLFICLYSRSPLNKELDFLSNEH